jgi:hypothetical protein
MNINRVINSLREEARRADGLCDTAGYAYYSDMAMVIEYRERECGKIEGERDRLLADEQDLLERISELGDENIKLREALERLIDKIGKDEWFASWAAEARAVLQEATE